MVSKIVSPTAMMATALDDDHHGESQEYVSDCGRGCGATNAGVVLSTGAIAQRSESAARG